MKLFALSTGILCLVMSTLHAQEVIAVAGDFHSNNESSLSWTIGELVTESTSNYGTILSQGFQQFTFVVPVLNLPDEGVAKWHVYPNPVSYNLILEAPDLSSYQGYKALLFDLQGKLLLSQTLNKKKSTIELSSLGSGTYLIKLVDRDSYHLYSFYIIKQ